jgi:hypothetical protein
VRSLRAAGLQDDLLVMEMIMVGKVPQGTLCKHDMTTGCGECHIPHTFRATGEWERLAGPQVCSLHGATDEPCTCTQFVNTWGQLAAHAAKAAEEELGPWIESRFNGTCRGCGHRWEPGELIRKDPAEDAWICSECGTG